MVKIFGTTTLLLLLVTCNTTEPPPPGTTITLTLEDVSSIEAWIKLATTNLEYPTTIKLKQNDSATQSIILNNPDTLLYIDGLSIDTEYSFEAIVTRKQFVSNKLVFRTLDTTNNIFSFESFTVGEFGSIVYDVAVLDDNVFIAVGEFYKENEYRAYGMALFNQGNWEFKRLLALTPSNGTSNIMPTSILAFSKNEIWLANGSVFLWDGLNVEPFWISKFPGNPDPIFSDGQFARKIWGNSNKNIYAGGESGALAHFDGTTWKKIELNTNLNITDLIGPTNNSNSDASVYCARTDFNFQNNGIIKINANSGKP